MSWIADRICTTAEGLEQESSMSVFTRELEKRQPRDISKRRWVFVPNDQLSDAIGPLAEDDPGSLGIVLVESRWSLSRRPYHKQKIALLLSSMRHFALEQAARGVAVRYLAIDAAYREALSPLIPELGTLTAMDPAERELREDLRPLAESGALRLVAHQGWLTSREQFLSAAGKSPLWRMDSFYRRVRRESGILMEDGKPAGGRFSLDAENRLPWHGDPPAPTPPDFPVDRITKEVGSLVLDAYAQHPGRLRLDTIPAGRAEALELYAWAKRSCLRWFGPYEDAMSSLSRTLFHTRLSPLLNIHRLLPGEVLADVQALYIPLASKEGFIRQILGWREFVRHIHLETEGFRDLPAGRPPLQAGPGDGGFGRWRERPWTPPEGPPELDWGAAPSFFSAQAPLPPAFWGETSGLACLDTVLHGVWEEGYSHHITRLMILSNLATLLDVSPRELTDWFWAAYTDAYDWVVEPNVLGMGTYAAGDLMSTKPYVSGTPYIVKMSDYCRQCAFHPKTNCPVSGLYWAFLERHGRALTANPRMKLVLASAARRSKAKKEADSRLFRAVSSRLAAGERLTPSGLS